MTRAEKLSNDFLAQAASKDAAMTDILRSSYEESMRNDLVNPGEEGRGKQRYARWSRKQAVIPGSPNGATHPESCQDTAA